MQSALKFSVQVTAATAILYFAGGLSARSSVVIVALIAMTWAYGQTTLAKSFSPHEIRITPQIGVMLLALGLTTDEEWKAISADEPPWSPWTQMHPVHYGLVAYVLARFGDGESLVHWTGANCYTSGIGYSTKIDKLVFVGQYLSWSPDFFLQTKGDGLHLGIEVNSQWWSTNAEHVKLSGVVAGEDILHHLGRARISFAVLPHKPFHIFYSEWSQRWKDEVTKDLRPLGWKVLDMGDAEIGYYGETYSNDFVSIWLRYLRSGI